MQKNFKYFIRNYEIIEDKNDDGDDEIEEE